MNIDEQIELLAVVCKEQVNSSSNKAMNNLLEDKINALLNGQLTIVLYYLL